MKCKFGDPEFTAIYANLPYVSEEVKALMDRVKAEIEHPSDDKYKCGMLMIEAYELGKKQIVRN